MTQPFVSASSSAWSQSASVAFRSIKGAGIFGKACRGGLEVRLYRVLNCLQDRRRSGSDGGWVLAKGCSELSEPHRWAPVVSLSSHDCC